MTQAASGKDGGRAAGLERDVIVAEALLLLDEVGFQGLTLRRLADRLKVKAAALYWHFENKQDLIDAIAERIMVGEYERRKTPDISKSGWRELLTTVAHTNRAALMRYRDGAQLMAHARMGQTNMLDGMELLLTSLAAQGLTPEEAMVGFFIIVRYTLGFVFEEQADPRSRQQLAERREHLQSVADRYPMIARSFTLFKEKGRAMPDYMFEQGLTAILDGLEYKLQKRKKAA
jgi:TetR/AcrR family tetracycline transcriptional repressor